MTPSDPSADIQQLQARVRELEADSQRQRETLEELRQRSDELEQTEALLRDSEARFRRIFDYSNDAILLLDPDLDRILDTNAEGCRLFGYTHREMQALPMSAVFPRDVARLQAFALSVVEIGHGWIDEVGGMTRTGDSFTAEVSASEIPVDGAGASLLVLLRDITQRKAADEEIRASLREKDVLLREIHHRVKNNLQVVGSLLDLQSARTGDDETVAMLRECRNRVRSMSTIHETLYRAHDLNRVDFRRYVTRLSEELVHSFGAETRVALQIDMDDVVLDVDQAIPCGLIVNELLSNALKYAYPDDGQGRLQVRVEVGESLLLTVADDGIGLPEDLDVAASPSLGLRLVHSLVDQLQGYLELHRDGGTRFEITVPVRAAVDPDRQTTAA